MAVTEYEVKKAVQKCCPTQLRCLFELGADANWVLDNNHNTALHLAAKDSGCLECVKLMFKFGAKLDVKNKRDQFPLHIACEFDNVEFVKLVVKEKNTSFNINCKNRLGYTGLHICVKKGHGSILTLLLKAGANVNMVDDEGNTALHCAVEEIRPHTDLSTIQMLADSNIDIGLKNNVKMTAYDLALDRNMCKYAQFLLYRTSQPNAADKWGNTLTHRIIDNKSSTMLRETITTLPELLFSKNKSGLIPMHYAAMTSYDEGVRLFLRNDIKECPSNALFMNILKGYDISFKKLLSIENMNHTDSQGRHLLQWAVLMKFQPGIDILLTKGVNVNHTDNLGTTALHLAVLKNNEVILTLLLEKGAQVNIKDGDGRTPLHLAFVLRSRSELKNNKAILSRLLKNGADVNVEDNDGRTPLHLASFLRSSLTIETLLKAGSLLNVQDMDGNTPLYLALESDNDSAVNTLLIWGARVDIRNKVGETCHSVSLHMTALESVHTLRRHMIKLKKANLEAYNGNSFFPESNLLLEESYQKELNEIVTLNNPGRFHLRDLLTEKVCFIIFDDELRSMVFSSFFRERYRCYGHLLQTKFYKTELRYRLLCESVTSPFWNIDGIQTNGMPNEVKWEICSHLSNEDLTNVIKAGKN